MCCCEKMKKLNILGLVLFSVCVTALADDEDEGPVTPPSKCEVCKYLAIELRDRLDETGKSKEVLETGHGIDPRKKKKIKYNTSELRLIEAINDPHICDKILQYNMHKERKGSLRFAKGMSETFQTLHGLVDRGVEVTMDVPYELWDTPPAEVTQMHKKVRLVESVIMSLIMRKPADIVNDKCADQDKGVNVELGIPYELWDTPSAEVTQMQRKCFKIVEDYEEEIEDWYYKHQDKDILDYLCRDHILKKDDQACLDEVFVPKGDDEETNKEDDKADKKDKKKDKKKKDKGKLKGDVGDDETLKFKKKEEL